MNTSHPRRARQAGFSMLEVLVAIGIFGVCSGAALPVFLTFIKRITTAQVKTEAIAVAQRKFDEMRETTIDSLPTSGTVGPETISGGRRTFQVYTTYCGNAAFCTTTRTRHLRVDVRYKGASVFNAESVFTRLR